MNHLLKYAIWIFVIFAFAGCKDDDDEEIEALTENVYEEWSKVSNDVINLNSRYVLRLNAFDSNLYIQCVKSFYHLNQNLEQKKHYLKGFGLQYGSSSIRMGSNYTINGQRDHWSDLKFNIYKSNDPFDDFWLVYDSIARPMTGGATSFIDNQGNFGVIYSKQDEDSISIYLEIYKITGDWREPAKRIDKVFLVKTRNVWAKIFDVNLINDVYYCSYYRHLARIENGQITKNFPFNLRNIQVYKNALIGIADNSWMGMPDEPQLLISYDNGYSWSSVMKGRTLNSGQLKVVGDEILLIRGWYVLLLDITNGTFKKIDMKGTDDYFSDVTKIGDKAILGTDAGVYYKSWESFLNK